jgi:hypothetical protein
MDKIDSIFSINQTKSIYGLQYFLRFAMNSSSIAEIPISVTSKSLSLDLSPRSLSSLKRFFNQN